MNQTQSGPQGLEELDPLDARVARTLDNIRCKLLVMSGKGGVGKSTVACQLALGLAERGFKVGLMDVDLHGPSLPRMLGLEGRAVIDEKGGAIKPIIYSPNLRVISVESLLPDRDSSVIWRGPLKIAVIKQFIGDVRWGELDYLIIDSPPGTGDEPLTVAQEVTGAMAVVVTTPQEIALADVRKSLDFCVQVELPVLGLVENMAAMTCPHCGEPIDLFGQGGGEATAKNYAVNFLGSIPLDHRITTAADQGSPLTLSQDDQGAGPAVAQVVEAIYQRTLGRS